jgi:hypothetical protein
MITERRHAPPWLMVSTLVFLVLTSSCWWGVNEPSKEGDTETDPEDVRQDDVPTDDARPDDVGPDDPGPDDVGPDDVGPDDGRPDDGTPEPPDDTDTTEITDGVDAEEEPPACPGGPGTPCDDGDDCTMLDVCDASSACTGVAECTGSPILGTGSDTRVAICLTDADCDSAIGGGGCTAARPPELKSSWTDWDEGTRSPMAWCGTYWATTSPPLDGGTEECYAFYHDHSDTWFYDGQDTPAVCGPDHCGHDACGFTP